MSSVDDGPEMLVPESTWQDARHGRKLRRRMTDWFANAARSLPWRDDPTPYKVWVSEIMCQQTQIATVLPYFHRFIERYPDVAALAAADDDELMRLWEGLGYYRRARSLKQAAGQIVARHGGKFPDTFDDVVALAGIGRYTAGAILSISGNHALPILEGNTVRVYSRWIGLRGDVKSKSAQNTLWSVGESILPRRATSDRSRGPAAINQAAMELGALICTPKDPACGQCPVAGMCAAHASGLQNEIPGKVSRIQYEARTEHALVTQRLTPASDEVLVRQIAQGQRFAGMWDFPRIGPPEADSLTTACDWLAAQWDGAARMATVVPGPRLSTIKHGVTKYRMTLHVHRVDVRDAGPASPPGWQWMTIDDLASMPMSVTTRKIVQLLRKNDQPLLSM